MRVLFLRCCLLLIIFLMLFAEPVYFILHVLHYFFERALFPEPGISTFDFHLVIVNELLLDH